MVSHRSGETEDTFIADLAVGLASGQVPFSSCDTVLHLHPFYSLFGIILTLQHFSL
jgi:hypothetical protein